MPMPWKRIGVGAVTALGVGALPAGYAIHNALRRRDDLLKRAQELKDNQMPAAAFVGTGAALLSGLATYNTMKQRAEKKGWVDPAKYSALNEAFLAKRAFGSGVGRGLVGGALAGLPLAGAGYYFANKALAAGTRRMDEGEKQLSFWENNLLPVSAGAGALIGGIGTAVISRKKFQTPEQTQQAPIYFDPSMMR